VVDTPSFQRLRNLKQLQMAHLTYPNATHTRFAHSLGVFAVMSRVLAVAKDALDISEDDVEDLRLAALLHDVGHYPYSHLMERIDSVELTEETVASLSPVKKTLNLVRTPYPEHEELGRIIVTTRPDLVEAIGGKDRACRIADLFTRSKAADQQLSKLIHSSLDMDRFDFLLRDTMATGVPYGTVDLHYLLANVQVSKSGMIGFSHKAMSAAEHFLFARFFMYKVVYFHKTTFGLEEACRQLLRRCRDEGVVERVPKSGDDIRTWVTKGDFLSFTDAWVDNVVAEAGKLTGAIGDLARCILFRRPPSLIREVAGLRDSSSRQDSGVCKAFYNRCQDRLTDLAEELGVDLKLFLVVPSKTIKLEPRSSNFTRATAEEFDEQTEDLVKIFEKGHAEPTSLVDINSSITHAAAMQAYQFARLYLVSDDEDVVESAKQQVARW